MTYTQVFNDLCPMYMLYGMTYEQFWEGDPWMAKAYAQAYLLERKRKNEELWLNGIYVANAFGVVLNNAFNKSKKKYLAKPLEIFEKTEAEKEQEKRAQRKRMVEWLNNWKKAVTKRESNKGADQNANTGNA